LPLPVNPDPAPIRYSDFRRVLDAFRRDLMDAEAVLAAIRDDQVVLPLRLADIRLDLDGDGVPNDQFLDVLRKIMRRDASLLQDNPKFLVRFDRGDVAWLRAYCHLLSSMIDVVLAFDTRSDFDLWSREAFARPKDSFSGTDEERLQRARASGRVARIVEPARLDRFRRHVIAVAELNRETWKYVRAETDSDHEWLPNPKQKGVLPMPVRDEMIDAWLRAATEIELLMEGKKLIPILWRDAGGKGINLKTLCENPPLEFQFDELSKTGFPDKYLEHGPSVNLGVFITAWQVFDNTTAFGYMAWFN
jgi:hypothetical protein